MNVKTSCYKYLIYYYSLYSNGDWGIGKSNYHKIYEKLKINSPLDELIIHINELENKETKAYLYKLDYQKQRNYMDNIMEKVVNWTWNKLSEESDEIKLKSLLQNLTTDHNLTNIPRTKSTESINNNSIIIPSNKEKKCKCGSNTHQRTNFKQCSLNKKNLTEPN